MAKKPLPSPDELRQLLRYEPDTGKLFWLMRNSPGSRRADGWNSKHANTEAFKVNNTKNGYLYGTVMGQSLLAHRVAWAIYHGHWPEREIDHIDGNRKNNRICNLRDVTRALNNRNVRPKVGGQSQYLGVFPSPNGTWNAAIGVDGKKRHLGAFDCEQCAARAYDAAAIAIFGAHARPNFPLPPRVADMLAGEATP